MVVLLIIVRKKAQRNSLHKLQFITHKGSLLVKLETMTFNDECLSIIIKFIKIHYGVFSQCICFIELHP